MRACTTKYLSTKCNMKHDETALKYSTSLHNIRRKCLIAKVITKHGFCEGYKQWVILFFIIMLLVP